ncbi:MAG: SIS domain-containing protein, partial [Clostridia bacterium]|nr:SIS domain-containing protein [Clostridia bacterium]
TEKWEEIKRILKKCPTAAACKQMMEAVGLRFSECIETYGAEKIRDAMLYGKDLKNRYSVLWIYYTMFSGMPDAVDFRNFNLENTHTSFHLADLACILEQIPARDADRVTDAIKSHSRIFLYGAGRSGLMIKAFAMRLAQAGYLVHAVGEVTTPAIERGDLLILASASGETASVLRAAQTAKAVGATVLSLSAGRESALATLSDAVIYLSAPTKDDCDGGSIMGTLFEQSVLLFCDAIVERLGVDAAKMRTRHANLE